MLSPFHVACRACSRCVSPSQTQEPNSYFQYNKKTTLTMHAPRLTAPDVCFMLDAPVPPAPVASSNPPSPLGPVAKANYEFAFATLM